jgi:hypothetical protein
MKVKLLHHASEWLPSDYETPETRSTSNYLTVRRLHRDSRTGLIGMALTSGGTGVWDKYGRLVHFIERGADLSWCRDSPDLLSLEVQFGQCRAQKGVPHVLKRLDTESYRTLGEMEICVPTGGVEYLVLSHQGDKCLATWLDQTEWGYVIVDLKEMSQLPAGLCWPSPTLAPPDFSPTDASIVSCNFFRSGWWVDELDDYWEFASPGGLRKVGVISVHDVRSDTFSHHDVLVALPPGWKPDQPDRPEWDAIWGPAFVSEREFHIWLPDDSIELLTLPLPPRVEIRREIRSQRVRWRD